MTFSSWLSGKNT